MLFKIIIGKAIIKSAKASKHIFCFKVIALSLTKLSRCFLYNFVLVNQLLNLSDPFAKQNDAKRRNGVVGSTGKTTPILPKITAITPIIIYMYLTILLHSLH